MGIARNALKSGCFLHSKWPPAVIFQDIFLKFGMHIYLLLYFHIYSGFLEKMIFFRKKIQKKIFVVYFYNFQNFEKFKISRWQSDSTDYSESFGENRSIVSSNVYVLWRFPQTLIFGLNRQNMTSLWRH